MTTKVQAPTVAGDKAMDGKVTGRVSPTIVLLAGWLVPGAGHLLLGKRVRAALLMISILSMFAIGHPAPYDRNGNPKTAQKLTWRKVRLDAFNKRG